MKTRIIALLYALFGLLELTPPSAFAQARVEYDTLEYEQITYEDVGILISKWAELTTERATIRSDGTVETTRRINLNTGTVKAIIERQVSVPVRIGGTNSSWRIVEAEEIFVYHFSRGGGMIAQTNPSVGMAIVMYPLYGAYAWEEDGFRETTSSHMSFRVTNLNTWASRDVYLHFEGYDKKYPNSAYGASFKVSLGPDETAVFTPSLKAASEKTKRNIYLMFYTGNDVRVPPI
ncbi:MAG: hypothetical protein A2928_02105 [Candidatus Taylorbacteria bacterium RIFCSPLOWO2_01_FULL_45_15b]|uniref:Uncharacterized protein n=1 Tax=Candidatus Taylorbacteria bacterium RIFCSPLOWO2_01_FULL_45_15b TaxID=1802319 RepID=A0A1G2N9D0_9BACT|nr:MAG: hypothetical protein A2928_02105 [Candidatus Taylorbacteria bacterium RIFCSPLOWO2_01_FULL_45_15b]